MPDLIRNPAAPDWESVHLADDTTIAQYLVLEGECNQQALGEFVRRRFAERYLDPCTASSSQCGGPAVKSSGFTMMAICCLCIESLECFRRGWRQTRRPHEQVFRNFFDREQGFAPFRGYSKSFYANVRCGILHQAETTGGWRIWLKGLLFDSDRLTINASLFADELRKAIDHYVNELQDNDWDSDILVNFRKKMKSILDNCRRPSQ